MRQDPQRRALVLRAAAPRPPITVLPGLIRLRRDTAGTRVSPALRGCLGLLGGVMSAWGLGGAGVYSTMGLSGAGTRNEHVGAQGGRDMCHECMGAQQGRGASHGYHGAQWGRDTCHKSHRAQRDRDMCHKSPRAQQGRGHALKHPWAQQDRDTHHKRGGTPHPLPAPPSPTAAVTGGGSSIPPSHCSHLSGPPGSRQPRTCSSAVSPSWTRSGSSGAQTVKRSEACRRRDQKSTRAPRAPRLSLPPTNTASQASETWGATRRGGAGSPRGTREKGGDTEGHTHLQHLFVGRLAARRLGELGHTAPRLYHHQFDRYGTGDPGQQGGIQDLQLLGGKWGLECGPP